jgi:hypothetical protein
VTEPRAKVDTRTVILDAPTYAQSRGLPRLWPNDYALKVEIHETYVSIAGDAEGLRGLAAQLLALTAEDVPPGYAHDLLADGIELDAGSVPLSIFRH